MCVCVRACACTRVCGCSLLGSGPRAQAFQEQARGCRPPRAGPGGTQPPLPEAVADQPRFEGSRQAPLHERDVRTIGGPCLTTTVPDRFSRKITLAGRPVGCAPSTWEQPLPAQWRMAGGREASCRQRPGQGAGPGPPRSASRGPRSQDRQRAPWSRRQPKS